jgi:iron transport multicopper oxidase
MFWGLINGLGRQPGHDDMPLDTFQCTTGGQTRLRMMNGASVFGYRMKVHGHQMTVVSTDGNDIVNIVVDAVILFPGERYDVLIDCNQAERE